MNTAEQGCGNGFSLTAALTQGLSFPTPAPWSSSTCVDRNLMSRAHLLSIIEDALQIIDGELSDGEFDESDRLQCHSMGLSSQ